MAVLFFKNALCQLVLNVYLRYLRFAIVVELYPCYGNKTDSCPSENKLMR